MDDWRRFVTEPEGGFAPESDENPYIEGVPTMAWLSATAQAAGIDEGEAEGDGVLSAMIFLVIAARGTNVEPGLAANIVRGALPQYLSLRAALRSDSPVRGGEYHVQEVRYEDGEPVEVRVGDVRYYRRSEGVPVTVKWNGWDFTCWPTDGSTWPDRFDATLLPRPQVEGDDPNGKEG